MNLVGLTSSTRTNESNNTGLLAAHIRKHSSCDISMSEIVYVEEGSKLFIAITVVSRGLYTP
jgi:hypothetical protein